MVEREVEADRRRWDEIAPIHARSNYYDVAGFKAGRCSLLRVEREELGRVDKKDILHLQCHIGLDTLSLARLGANVTGVDYSGESIRIARRIADETSLPARFVHSDLYDLLDSPLGQYDTVFSSYGVLCWLPDLEGWSRTIERHLRPGGFFYLIDDHPAANMISESEPSTVEMSWPYFQNGGAQRFKVNGTYADREAEVEHDETFEWTHSLGQIVTALADAGLHIEHLHEFPFTFFPKHPSMERRSDGYWYFRPDRSFPMMFSLKASKNK